MISVITPVYNGERFIEACIKVVIEQNCPDVEHIIVDGGSTDQTIEIIRQYAEKYPHIRWISEKDKGQSDAMNKGIAMAKGEILSFLNVDDYYELNVFKRVLEMFKTIPEPSLLVGNCNIWDDEGNLLELNKPSKLKLNELLLGWEVNPIPANPTAYFYHKSLHQQIGLYKVDEHYAMDLDFILKAVQVAVVKYVDETWGNFRLLKGTKTFGTHTNNQVGSIMKRVFDTHRANLPWFQQWQVIIQYKLHKTKKWFQAKVKFYSNNPKEISVFFIRKLRKVLGLTSCT